MRNSSCFAGIGLIVPITAAGGAALTSAVPSLQPWTLWLCLAVLLVITLVNLRGTQEAGLLFTLPPIFSRSAAYRARQLRTALLREADQRWVIVNVPWRIVEE